MKSEKSEKKAKRTSQITVRLEPKILDGLNEIADRLGISQSTVAGLAIGDFVAKNQAQWLNQNNAMAMMIKEMAQVIGSPIAGIFEGMELDDVKAFLRDDEDNS